MRWFRLLAIFATLAFVFVGCDDKDSNEAKKYELQKALDDGDYAKVLRMTSNCGNDEACNMDRAAAYMGRAGFTLPSVMVAISDNSDQEFYKTLGRNTKSTSVDDLNNSKSIYKNKIISKYGTTPCEKGTADHNKASYHAKSACFNNGMVTMAQSATLMSKLSDINASGSLQYAGDSKDDADAVAALLNGDDLEDLSKLFGVGEDVDIKKEIDDIKSDICSTVTSCNVASITGQNIIDFIVAKQ